MCSWVHYEMYDGICFFNKSALTSIYVGRGVGVPADSFSVIPLPINAHYAGADASNMYA